MRVVLAAAIGLLAPLGVTAAPAFAGQSASVAINRSCGSGQVMTSVQFKLTKVPKFQRITVPTEGAALTREHVSYEDTGNNTGTARYDIALNAKLSGDPATTYIASDTWTGGFWMTGATCQAVKSADVSAEGSTCDSQPYVAVNVTNPNPVTVTYKVGGQLPNRVAEIPGKESRTLTYRPVDRGRDYQVAVEGSDGTRSSAVANVPTCETPTTEPSQPPLPTEGTPTEGATVPPGTPNTLGVPGVPSVPGAPPALSVSASAAANPATSAGTTTAPSNSTSASPAASLPPVPTAETDVDPFAPLLQAEGDGTTVLAAGPSRDRGLSNSLTLLIAVIIGGLFAGAAVINRRQTGKRG